MAFFFLSTLYRGNCASRYYDNKLNIITQATWDFNLLLLFLLPLIKHLELVLLKPCALRADYNIIIATATIEVAVR